MGVYSFRPGPGTPAKPILSTAKPILSPTKLAAPATAKPYAEATTAMATRDATVPASK